MQYSTPPLSTVNLHQAQTLENFVYQPLDIANPQQYSQYSPPLLQGNLSSSSVSSSPTTEGGKSEMSLKLKNNISKCFEDDLFFCPRGLLTSQELSTCQQMDLFMLEQIKETLPPQQPKFNPYKSQSFSPAPGSALWFFVL